MMNSVLIAAPLLIAAIVMAVRFVGCGLATGGHRRPVVVQRHGVGQRGAYRAFWQLNDTSGSTTAVDSATTRTTGRIRVGSRPALTGLVSSMPQTAPPTPLPSTASRAMSASDQVETETAALHR